MAMVQSVGTEIHSADMMEQMWNDKYKNTKIQKYKNTKIQKYKNTKAQNTLFPLPT